MRRLKALWTRSRGADRRPGHTTRPGRRPAPIGTIDWNGDKRRYRWGADPIDKATARWHDEWTA